MPTIYNTAKPFTYNFDAILGYQYFFNNGADINAYYQYHFFNGDSVYNGINYTHSVNLSAGYLFNNFYFYTDGSIISSKPINYFTNVGLGYFFSHSIKNSKIELSAFPIISVALGTDYWIYSNLTTTEKNTLILNIKQAGYKPETFTYQNIDIILPINIIYKQLSIGISYIISLSSAKYKYIGIDNNSGLMLTANYTLNFNQ